MNSDMSFYNSNIRIKLIMLQVIMTSHSFMRLLLPLARTKIHEQTSNSLQGIMRFLLDYVVSRLVNQCENTINTWQLRNTTFAASDTSQIWTHY